MHVFMCLYKFSVCVYVCVCVHVCVCAHVCMHACVKDTQYLCVTGCFVSLFFLLYKI